MVIPRLADPSDAYNQQHVYIVASLAEVKSIILLPDLDHPDTLILALFTTCFDIVSGSSKASTGEEIAKHVEHYLQTLLIAIIDEATSLAPEIVDVIVAQFLRVDPHTNETANSKSKKNGTATDEKQSTLRLKDYPPAYNMAKMICNECLDKMTSFISQYFNNVIVDASSKAQLNEKSKLGGRKSLAYEDSEDEGEDMKDLGKAHRLIRELWRACPDVLQNTIPQLEAELAAESVALRLLATETLGDLAAGVGVAGAPPPAIMDPAAYPPADLIQYQQYSSPLNPLIAPVSAKPFSRTQSVAYDAFIGRRQDKSPAVRAAWAKAVGRILFTQGGSVGLIETEEKHLIAGMIQMLQDADEKVRLMAVEAVSYFGFTDIVHRLSRPGGIKDSGSLLAVLAERAKDRRPVVRETAMKLLARIWGVAAGEIEEGNDQVIAALGDAPTKLFEAYFTNDTEVFALLDYVLFELLLPLSYPPIKVKSSSKTSSSQSQKVKSSQKDGTEAEVDVDKIRVQRILTLVRCFDERTKRVFFIAQSRQPKMKDAMSVYLTACEEYNGGILDKDEDRMKARLTKVIDSLSKQLPEPNRVSSDMWKFAKAHDRRNYQLIRFAMDPNSDYRTVIKAIKELTRRLQGTLTNSSSVLDTLMQFLYRSASLVYNRSHIPAIIEFSKTNEHNLSNAAHEMLKEISTKNPQVLEAHVQDMCRDLQNAAPSEGNPDEQGWEDLLKACAGFARKLPEKLPKERKFIQAMMRFALYSEYPRAAKHAVSIIMLTAERRELQAKELIEQCTKDCTYGSPYFLTRLAAISQLNFLAPKEADMEADAIIDIAINQVLLKNREPDTSERYEWVDEPDEETSAKEWALHTIVNRLRAKDASTSGSNKDSVSAFKELAAPVFRILNMLISGSGELSKARNTPATQKPRLRLLAAKLMVKICSTNSMCDELLKPADFVQIALVAQDPLFPVRAGFINKVKKHLMQVPNTYLHSRWYLPVFLLAFEPDVKLREQSLTWLKSRAVYWSRQKRLNSAQQQQPVMESLFTRLLSLLAYHPDYPASSGDDTEPDPANVHDLLDLTRYILFYLSAVANSENLSLIFHYAQRVKQVRDFVTESPSIDARLYTLSDLSQATIRRFAEIYSQQHHSGGSTNVLQTYPGKMALTPSLFARIKQHDQAQKVAEKNYLPEEAEDILDRVVKSYMRPPKTNRNADASKKRKSEIEGEEGVVSAKKKVKKDGVKRKSYGGGNAKTPTKRRRVDEWGSDDDDDDVHARVRSSSAIPASERRRSGRGVGKAKGVNYAEDSDEDEDEEMEEVGADEEESQDEEDEVEEEDEDEVDDEEEEANTGQEITEPSSPPSQTPKPVKSTPRRGKATTITTTAASTRRQSSRRNGNTAADEPEEEEAEEQDEEEQEGEEEDPSSDPLALTSPEPAPSKRTSTRGGGGAAAAAAKKAAAETVEIPTRSRAGRRRK